MTIKTRDLSWGGLEPENRRTDVTSKHAEASHHTLSEGCAREPMYGHRTMDSGRRRELPADHEHMDFYDEVCQ